ncbi:HNH endonuclease [Akkermansiaceae bacterium]|nr:HNH endonuclease [Akkermansiaceae bacterium]MDB4675591.1 HNH endonuclease [Akkermansiaceae bacterium]
MTDSFGHPEGISAGDVFPDRKTAAIAGVHRPTQAGICGSSKSGCESIVLSGGYEDDSDDGLEILYTGAGGNNPNNRQQIADQELIRGNKALAVSCDNNLPVRVLRGAKHKKHFNARAGYEQFAPPPSGYRYDGLYQVTDYWADTGKSGHRIWRFKLILVGDGPNARSTTEAQKRQAITTNRIIRDPELPRKIKELYNYRCQICGEKVETLSGPYAEAAHIRPLGAPHNGPDSLDNLLCLCPNHHVALDKYGYTIADDGTLIGIDGKLTVKSKHQLNSDHIKYHREQYELAIRGH